MLKKLFGNNQEKSSVPKTSKPPNRQPHYAIVLLWNYAIGCDPSGVDDFCDEYWFVTKEAAFEAYDRLEARSKDPDSKNKTFASIGVEFRNYEEGKYEIVRGVNIKKNCKCSEHRGELTKQESEELASVDQLANSWIQTQEKQGAQQKYGPSVFRHLKAEDMYDEVLSKETAGGSSLEKSHTAGITAVNKMLSPGGPI